MKPIRLAVALVLLQSLLGCAVVGPDYHLPAEAAINRPSANAGFAGAHGTAVTLAPVPDNWWRLYDDPALNRLVQQALAANTNVRVAAANLRRTLALRDEVDAEAGFHGAVEGAAKRAQESGEQYLLSEKLPVVNEGDAGLSVSYDLDLFGKLKRAGQAATADAQASQAALDLVRVNVAAQTVRAYVESCAATQALSVARRQLALQSRSVDIAKRLEAAGRGRSTDVLRAQAQADLLRANLPKFEAAHEAALLQLAVMVGKTPREFDASALTCARAPTLHRPIPVGNGTALLRRRPDVREAERQLAAATARIGVATAALYPDIVIGASGGFTGVLEDLGKSSTGRWNFGPLISWTLPDNGARARVRGARAGTEAALAHFDGVVLDALKETETALTRYTHDLASRGELRAARDAARQAAQQNRVLYQAGKTPYLASLDADRTLADTDAALAAADRQVALDQVNLFLALGGGWQGTEANPARLSGSSAVKSTS